MNPNHEDETHDRDEQTHPASGSANLPVDPNAETQAYPVSPEEKTGLVSVPGAVDPNAETQVFPTSSTEKTGPVRAQRPADPNAQTVASQPYDGGFGSQDDTQVILPGEGWNSDQTRPSLPYTYPYPGQNTPQGFSPDFPQDVPPQYPPQYPQVPPRHSGQTQPYPSGGADQRPYYVQEPISQYQPIPVARPQPPAPQAKAPRAARPQRQRRRLGCGCGCAPIFLIVLLLVLGYFLAPISTRILVVGADRAPEGTMLSRTDTMILTSVNPLLPDVRLLSIPRDLWINIPDVGENRINTVHFFAENNQPGSGPATTARVVAETFGMRTPYYVRLRFDGVVGIVDAMGGVDINLPEAMSGYKAGLNHLNGEQALAFSRDRAGSDDFFRMARGQILIKAVVQQLLRPATWVRLPQIMQAGLAMIDTDIPVWQWPRLGVALARGVVFGGMDSRTFDRSMATPYVTADGAQVLLPQWDLIRPVMREMFGAG